jgi:lipopolysaccharide transport system permease protein
MLLYQREPWFALLNPVRIVGNLYSHRVLLWQFVWRNIELQHKGSTLGVIWSILSPLLLFGVYGFVFIVVFEGRFGVVPTETRIDYAIGLFLGLTMLQLVQETMTVTPTVIIQNPNFVKKVVFPLEVLPAAALGAALFRCLVALVLVVLATEIWGSGLSSTVWWLPVLVLLLGVFSMGVAWILSALGVFLRDLAPLMQFFSVLLMFISGVFYSISKIPEAFSFLRFNPLAVFLETARGALLWNVSPTSAELLCLGAISMLTCLVGYALFANLKSAFADVL